MRLTLPHLYQRLKTKHAAAEPTNGGTNNGGTSNGGTNKKNDGTNNGGTSTTWTGSSGVRPDARQPDGCQFVERQARQGPQMRYCLWAPECVETPSRGGAQLASDVLKGYIIFREGSRTAWQPFRCNKSGAGST